MAGRWEEWDYSSRNGIYIYDNYIFRNFTLTFYILYVDLGPYKKTVLGSQNK